MIKQIIKILGKKLLCFTAILLFGALLGCVYGILNDQITYSISPEYYTKFKFSQFGVSPETAADSPRLGAAWVGICATWWAGAILAALLGLFGFMQKSPARMLATTGKAAAIVICVAVAAEVLGGLLGIDTFYIPKNVVDKESFRLVGTLHNWAYGGGAVGFFAALIYIFSARIADDIRAAK